MEVGSYPSQGSRIFLVSSPIGTLKDRQRDLNHPAPSLLRHVTGGGFLLGIRTNLYVG